MKSLLDEIKSEHSEENIWQNLSKRERNDVNRRPTGTKSALFAPIGALFELTSQLSAIICPLFILTARLFIANFRLFILTCLLFTIICSLFILTSPLFDIFLPLFGDFHPFPALFQVNDTFRNRFIPDVRTDEIDAGTDIIAGPPYDRSVIPATRPVIPVTRPVIPVKTGIQVFRPINGFPIVVGNDRNKAPIHIEYLDYRARRCGDGLCRMLF